MRTETIAQQISTLPVEAQKEVLEIVSIISRRYTKSNIEKRKSLLTQHKFIGLWKNRKDITSGKTWVRSLRKREWK